VTANVPSHTIASGKKPAEVTSSRGGVRFWPPSESTVRAVTTRAARAQQSNSHAVSDTSNVSLGGALGTLSGFVKNKLTSRWASSTQPIVVLSACKDEQLAADACIDGVYSGATTWALVRVLEQDPHPRLDDLMVKMHALMAHRGWEQEPQLALGKQSMKHPTWMMHWHGKAGGFLEVDQTVTRGSTNANDSGGGKRGIFGASTPQSIASQKQVRGVSDKSHNLKPITRIASAVSPGTKSQTNDNPERLNGCQWNGSVRAVSAFSQLSKARDVKKACSSRDDSVILPDASPRIASTMKQVTSASGGASSWVMGRINYAYAKTGFGASVASWGQVKKIEPGAKKGSKPTSEKTIMIDKPATVANSLQRSLFPKSFTRGGKVEPSR
jgi:hypothetical protein